MRTFANAFNKNCDMDYLPKEKTEQMTQKKAKNIYKIVGFSLIALCFVLSYIYRPYAYAHHLNDFHLADCYTSFFGIPLGVCLTQAYRSEGLSIPKNIVYVALLLI